MTGATPFTRGAGFLGLLEIPLLLVIVVALSLADAGTKYVALPAVAIGIAVGLTAVALGLVFFAGLLVRHRGCRWLRPAILLFVLSVASRLIGPNVLFDLGPALAMLVVYVGMLVAGFLPRVAVLLVLVAEPLDLIGVGAVAELMTFVGYTWLAWAMWREPVSSPLPVETGYRPSSLPPPAFRVGGL